MQKLFERLGWARLLMLGAIALVTLSQFYLAVGPHGTPYVVSTNVGHGAIAYGTAVLDGTPAMSGWAAHPQAWFVLPLLAAAFYFEWPLGVWSARLLYAFAFLGLFWCSVPLERSPVPGDDGMAMTYAFSGLALALVAIVAAWRSGRLTAPPQAVHSR